MQNCAEEKKVRVKYNKPKKVRITIVKTPLDEYGEPCSVMKEGQVFEFGFERCPADFCAAAFHSLWPMLRVIELGGRHPWDEKEGLTWACCPDQGKPVTMKIETLDPVTGKWSGEE